MKVKLLKNVRKAYEISYYPNGYYEANGIRSYSPRLQLSHNQYALTHCLIGDIEKLEILKAKMKDVLLSDILIRYKKYGVRRNKQDEVVIEKLWHNERS